MGPVGNLTASQFNSTTISVHFKRPYTLAGVPLMYMIHISSDDGTTDTHINTTSEGYQYVTHHWCPLYTLNITSVNGAGLGGTSAVSLAMKNGETTWKSMPLYYTQLHVYCPITSIIAPVFEGPLDCTVTFSSTSSFLVQTKFLASILFVTHVQY